mmetsp:Transcript_61786/g.201586  ORF Transcript_61786/g.201586 Transcript_61786/m.201586 type:complete len:505 (-) Transcript_61786:56-1570(-)
MRKREAPFKGFGGEPPHCTAAMASTAAPPAPSATPSQHIHTPSMLRQAAALLLQTAEASETELAESRAAAAEATRQAADLRAELLAAAEAMRKREARLEADLEAERRRCLELEAEVANLRSAVAALARGKENRRDLRAELEGHQNRGEDAKARVVGADYEELAAENARLKKMVAMLWEGTKKQGEQLEERNSLLRKCASQARTKLEHRQDGTGLAPRKRLRRSVGNAPGEGAAPRAEDVSAAVVAVEKTPGAEAEAIEGYEEQFQPQPRVEPRVAPTVEPQAASASTSSSAAAPAPARRKSLPTSVLSVPGLRVFRRRRVNEESQAPAKEPLPLADANRDEALALKSAFDVYCEQAEEQERARAREDALSGAAAAAGSIVASSSSRRPAPLTAGASTDGALAIRAEGRMQIVAAATEVKGGVPCRCVVRKRDARLALKAFDCEQCRDFHKATGLVPIAHADAGAVAWRAGPSASRHRFEHAPTNTPPGFWDLSFPQGSFQQGLQ